MSRQHDRWREKIAATSQLGGVIVGAPQARKPMESERFDAGAQTGEIEVIGATSHFLPAPAGASLPLPFHNDGASTAPSSTTSRSPAVTIEPAETGTSATFASRGQ